VKILMTLALLASPAFAQSPDICDNKPVYMVVNGVSHDRERMMAYGKALQNSGLYAQLQGYYINSAPPIAVFQGTVPPNYATLIVRFPCLAHARTFWYSKTYQETIKPMRENPSAGDFTVSVYAATDLPGHMKDKLKNGNYKQKFSDDAVKKIPRVAGQ
jgi:uncharacterized protein (DUF1330 family)